MAVTPLQLITAVSSVINGGELLKPYVVKTITDGNGETLLSGGKTVVGNTISKQTSDTMKTMLEGVVAEGGGKNAQVAGYRVGGWKYIINAKLHSRLVETVERYNNYGFTINEDGEEIPFTYLRHNRKALGIHYLIERYINRHNSLPIIDIPGYGKTMFIPMGFIFTDFIDEFKRPYFPTPQSYKGRNPSKLI